MNFLVSPVVKKQQKAHFCKLASRKTNYLRILNVNRKKEVGYYVFFSFTVTQAMSVRNVLLKP